MPLFAAVLRFHLAITHVFLHVFYFFVNLCFTSLACVLHFCTTMQMLLARATKIGFFFVFVANTRNVLVSMHRNRTSCCKLFFSADAFFSLLLLTLAYQGAAAAAAAARGSRKSEPLSTHHEEPTSLTTNFCWFRCLAAWLPGCMTTLA
jgi:hypothetical protein